jgi:hypothetical protein
VTKSQGSVSGRHISQSAIARSVFVVLLCAVAIVPLLRSESPCSHDGGLHYYRVVAIRHALQQDLFFTRWLPDLAFGYGFPFFNYRGPVSYYLALGFHLTGLSLPLALNLVYVFSILGSALGTYLLARDLFGPQAGVVASVAYAYAPYQFLDALVRGNAPESVALALLPFILWTFRRLALRGGRQWFLASVGLLTVLYVTHNISSLLFTPLLLAYLAVLWLVYRGRGQWKRVVLALALALGLTAFFWFPALAEKGCVQLYLTGATRNNDFHYNFLGLTEVLAPPATRDTSLMNPPLEIKLGLAQTALAGVGLILGLVLLWGQEGGATEELRPAGVNSTGREETREQRANLLFFAASAVFLVLMSTSASVWLWERVPFLSFVQFPWRFVGRASLPIALLGGATMLPFNRCAMRSRCDAVPFRVCALRLLPSVLVGVIVLAALSSTYPPMGYCPMKPYPTIQDLHRYERNSGLVGVDPVGAYFPTWVQQRPQGSPLEAQYDGAESVARFDESVLSEEVQVVEVSYGPNQAQVAVQSPEPFRARYLSFYFPGWRVWIDGERVEIFPSEPEGLITFEVPEGRHRIQIDFGETRLRLVADIISLLSLVALAVLTVWSPGAESELLSSPKSLSSRSVIPLVVLGFSLLAFKVGVVDQVDTPFRRPELRSDGSLPDVEHSLGQAFADGLKLIGYDQSADQMLADQALRVDLYWTACQQPSHRYQTVVHLVGPNGLRWSLKDSFRPTDYQGASPTTTWAPGRYALDSHEVEPLSASPPGTYDVVLTVFDRDTLAPLSALNEQGQPVAPEVVLGQVTLTAPRHSLSLEQLGARSELSASLGPVDLVGADFDHEEAAPGDPVLVTTFWRSEEELAEDLTFRLSLLTSDGSTVASYDLSPTADWHPTSTWEPGQVWRGQHLVHLPAKLNSGDYSWRFSISDSTSRLVHPSTIHVVAPERSFDPPVVDKEIGARLGNVATLTGVTRNPTSSSLSPRTPLTVTLVWYAEAETNVSYRVFVHLVGPNGELSAQSDGVPAEWARPTTGWLPGEYITDVHTLTIPSDAERGDYTLQAGLYRMDDGRLSTPAGSDTVSLGTVTVDREN